MDEQQGKLTIMLADDDPFILELYMAKLKREGFDVYTVGDGEEALLKIDSVRPDCTAIR
jgi:DNA-binding response OmpR family regulator